VLELPTAQGDKQNMLGLKIVTKSGLVRIEQNARNQALADLVELLREKDKIYLEPVTIVGDGQTIQDCVFLGMSNESAALIIQKHLD